LSQNFKNFMRGQRVLLFQKQTDALIFIGNILLLILKSFLVVNEWYITVGYAKSLIDFVKLVELINFLRLILIFIWWQWVAVLAFKYLSFLNVQRNVLLFFNVWLRTVNQLGNAASQWPNINWAIVILFH
jgi:hypothetical protein